MVHLLIQVILQLTLRKARCTLDVRRKADQSDSRWSWLTHCTGTGLRCNMGPSWGPAAWEKAVGTIPTEVYYQQRLYSKLNVTVKERL